MNKKKDNREKRVASDLPFLAAAQTLKYSGYIHADLANRSCPATCPHDVLCKGNSFGIVEGTDLPSLRSCLLVFMAQ